MPLLRTHCSSIVVAPLVGARWLGGCQGGAKEMCLPGHSCKQFTIHRPRCLDPAPFHPL